MRKAVITILLLFGGTTYGAEVALPELVTPVDPAATSPTPNWIKNGDSGIQACLARRKIPDGVWVRTAGTKTFTCSGKPPLRFQSPFNYSIRTFNGEVQIIMKLQLHYGHYGTQPSQRIEAFRQSNALEVCVEEYYKRNGINLRMETLTVTGPPTRTNPGRILIEMVNDVFTNNSTHWNAGLAKAIADGQGAGCGGVAHEVGHLLGLKDGHPADYCPNRKITPKDDIMYDSSVTSRLYPYAIRDFIQPLCK